MKYNRIILSAILILGITSIILASVSITGTRWATLLVVYQSGLFIGCANGLVAKLCNQKFLYPMHPIFKYVSDKSWLIVLRVLVIVGLICNFFAVVATLASYTNEKYKPHALILFLIGGILEVISPIIYYYHIFLSVAMLDVDSYLMAGAGMSALVCSALIGAFYLKEAIMHKLNLNFKEDSNKTSRVVNLQADSNN